jgi:hypothetical protein
LGPAKSVRWYRKQADSDAAQQEESLILLYIIYQWRV